MWAAVWPMPAQAAEPDCPPPPTLSHLQPPPDPEAWRERIARSRDRGFLWQLRRDGRTSWLYGTLHLGRAEWVVPGPRLHEALQAADALVLEIDPLDTAAAAPPTSPAASLRISDAQRTRLRRQLEHLCAQALADAPLHPTMLLTVASVMGARADGLEVVYGSELLLAAAARAQHKPVLALETAAQQMAALIPAEPAAQAREFEQLLQQLEQGQARPIAQRLAQAWEAGRFDEIERYEQWCACAETPEARAQMRRLLDDRHPAMVERIEGWHRGGRSLFVAVGTLHLVGPRALPALLARRGFTVERIDLSR